MTHLNRSEVLALDELPFVRPSSDKSAPRVRSFSITSHRKVRQSQSLSGHIQTRASGVQWYELRISFAAMKREDLLPILVFLEQMEGRDGLMRVPIENHSSGTGAVAGHYINFDTDHKLHLVTEVETVVGTGGTTSVTVKSVKPAERTINNLAIADDVYMVCSLKQDSQVIEINERGTVRLTLSLVERI